MCETIIICFFRGLSTEGRFCWGSMCFKHQKMSFNGPFAILFFRDFFCQKKWRKKILKKAVCEMEEIHFFWWFSPGSLIAIFPILLYSTSKSDRRTSKQTDTDGRCRCINSILLFAAACRLSVEASATAVLVVGFARSNLNTLGTLCS